MNGSDLISNLPRRLVDYTFTPPLTGRGFGFGYKSVSMSFLVCCGAFEYSFKARYQSGRGAAES